MVEEINKRRSKNLPTAAIYSAGRRKTSIDTEIVPDAASCGEEREEEETKTQLSREEKKGKIKESAVCKTEERKRDLNRSKPQRAARVGPGVLPPHQNLLTQGQGFQVLVYALRPIDSHL
ncbi:hypothetical protein M9H77_14170 [Catharanthus roseus]|uniref:Uncharacterized protein n=1 Tax=Catharanthus roseus TaxID=4058 RepID=A0ACC0BME4_CATRO|nr:hypothetical protein M9H77_14170 [Catharanthus roseus]